MDGQARKDLQIRVQEFQRERGGLVWRGVVGKGGVVGIDTGVDEWSVGGGVPEQTRRFFHMYTYVP